MKTAKSSQASSTRFKFRAVHSLKLKRLSALIEHNEAGLRTLDSALNRCRLTLKRAAELGITMPNTKLSHDELLQAFELRKSFVDKLRYSACAEVSRLHNWSGKNGQ